MIGVNPLNISLPQQSALFPPMDPHLSLFIQWRKRFLRVFLIAYPFKILRERSSPSRFPLLPNPKMPTSPKYIYFSNKQYIAI